MLFKVTCYLRYNIFIKDYLKITTLLIYSNMSESISYTRDELKKMILVKIYSEGPFTLDEWLIYTNESDIPIDIPGEFMDREAMLINYPDFYDISVETRIYNDRCLSNIYKTTFVVCQKTPPLVPEQILPEEVIDTVESDKYSGKIKGFKLFSFPFSIIFI